MTMKERIYIDDMTHPPFDQMDQMEDIEKIKNELMLIKAKIRQNELREEGLIAKIKEVEETYEKVKSNLQKAASTGEFALRDLKEGLYNAWADLKQSVERAARRFDS